MTKFETTLQELGVRDRPVCIHSSMRSFGAEGVRAEDLIEDFLSLGCTVMVPTFTHRIHGVYPPPDIRPERNGTDYEDRSSFNADHDRVYSPQSNDVSPDMGALPRAVLERPDRVRGANPLSSFATVGPLAHRLIDKQTGDDVYAPLAELARLDGFVILVGVDLDRMTLLHLAEKRAGRKLFRRWALASDGAVAIVQSGGCSEGFVNLEPALRPVRKDVMIGESRWQVFPAKSALNIATHAIRRNPRITHCGKECLRCDDAVRGGPLV